MAQPHLQGPRGYWLPIDRGFPSEVFFITFLLLRLLRTGIHPFTGRHTYLPIYLSTCLSSYLYLAYLLDLPTY